jgi:glycosyltransferase involved in cell wall biosynthesis
MLGEYPARPDSIDGGVAAVVTYLSEALAARPDVDLSGVRVQGEHGSGGKAFGYPVYDIPKGSLGLTSLYSAQRRRLGELVKSINPDIIHAQGADLPGYLALRSRIPAVVTVHGMVGEDARYKTRLRERARGTLTSWLIERPTVRAARSVILISPYVANYYGKTLRGRIFDIANPVSSRYFEVRRNPSSGRMLYAGRVIPRKGILELVRAVAAMPDSLQPRLVIAGALSDRAYERKVRKAISDTNTAHRFELKGRLGESDLLREFALAQALVLPSFQETAPMVIQQAMAAGIPVVASRICGIPYQVQEGVTGFMVEPGDVEGLRSQLMRLLADSALALQFGDNARAAARTNYVASAVAQATVEAYRVTLSEAAA